MIEKLNEKKVISQYGHPNIVGKDYLTRIRLPYPMRLAWDRGRFITSASVHFMIAEILESILQRILEHYGIDKIRILGLDIFGGIFNYRPVEGGKDLSIHSWGAAIDMHPEKNQMNQTSKTALFAQPEYDALHKIFEEHDFINLGKTYGIDWMHFEPKGLRSTTKCNDKIS